ncbi:hypothetical protein [Nonomuraea sp. NPDC005501]|uniref:hypothetical protein n=1 Tax=Nonomuraea sp. NPDC005501 TaxID=3156884 RepID=UPI0033BB0CD8
MIRNTMTRTALATLVTAGLTLGALAPAAHAATSGTTFGPAGYGGVKLGMSAKAAQATGKISHKKGLDSPSCTGWQLKAHPTGSDGVGLYISKKHGVAMIFASKGVKTPAGIGLGSTYKQIKKAYPKVKTAASGYPYVDVPGVTGAYYSFLLQKGKVYEMALALHKQDCAN